DGARPGCGAPFDARRTGAILGEGAAFAVLEAEEVARARGARITGRFQGWANGYDPDALSGGVRGGDVLAQTIGRALADADVRRVDVVSASASGDPSLDALEATAIAATVGAETPVTAIKSVTGESLGAAGAMQAILALHAMRCRRVPGISGLARV